MLINPEKTELDLLESLMVIIGEKPILVSDVREALLSGEVRRPGEKTERLPGGRWRNVSALDAFDLKRYGFHIAARTHGSGIAYYAATIAFSEVYDCRRNKMIPVSAR